MEWLSMSVEIKKDDLEDLEESMYDCWNITTDIAKILDISDNIEDASGIPYFVINRCASVLL